MILQILNFDLTLVGEISVLKSVSMERSFAGVGKFTLHLHPRSPNAHLIKKDMVLMPPGKPSHAFLVQDMEKSRDSLVVRGVQVKGIVQRRICVPPLNLPQRLWQYTGGAWVEITDQSLIKSFIQGEILQGYEKPETVTEGLLWLDLKDIASVYNWDSKSKIGEVWLDLETAQVRSHYKNFGYDRVTTDGESALLHYLSNNLINPEDRTRKISGLVLASNQHRGAVYPWQARFDKLEDVLKRISEATGVGWDMSPDFANGTWTVYCYEGRDLTESNAGRVVTISLELGNAADVKYKEQSAMASNVAYVGGAGEDENRMILAIPPKGESLATGFARCELWSEAGSTDDPAMATLAGEKKLAESAIKQSVTADVLDSGALRYGRDWDVGDIVIVELKDAKETIRIESRVNSVTETIETDRPRRLAVVFGDAPVTINSVLDSASKLEAVR